MGDPQFLDPIAELLDLTGGVLYFRNVDGPELVYEHPVRGTYVERYWLPLMGPTAYCFLRRAVLMPTDWSIDVGVLAATLGILPGSGGRGSKLVGTLARLIRWNHLYIGDDHVIRVHTRLPSLSRTQIRRLPAILSQELGHTQEVAS